jgi:hypothetical protein
MTAEISWFTAKLPNLRDKDLIEEYRQFLRIKENATRYIEPIEQEIKKRVESGSWSVARSLVADS